MKKSLQKSLALSKAEGFTLIELLIVIGILAVLVVTILITLNPAEAQRKSRDVKRIKDASTIAAILEQYISSGGAPICTAAAGCLSTDASGSQNCNGTGWLVSAVSLCSYSNTIPIDPANGSTRTYISGGTVAAPTTTTGSMFYQVKMSGSDYEITVRQESTSNAGNVLNDGGTSATAATNTSWVQSGSNLSLF